MIGKQRLKWDKNGGVLVISWPEITREPARVSMIIRHIQVQPASAA